MTGNQRRLPLHELRGKGIGNGKGKGKDKGSDGVVGSVSRASLRNRANDKQFALPGA